MQVVLTILALDAIFLACAAASGRLWPWGGVILAVPMVGTLAYVLVEFIPEWMEDAMVRQAGRDMAARLDR